MSDPEDFATLFAREAARPVLEVGQVVKGRVIQISAESVFVDVGGKGEAWIERAELTDDEGRLRVGIGDQVEATVVSTGDGRSPGVSQITGEVAKMVAQVPELFETLTGMKVSDLLERLQGIDAKPLAAPRDNGASPTTAPKSTAQD